MLKKISRTGTIHRQQGSGRPRSMRVNENNENTFVEDLLLSQKDDPKMHRSICVISREAGIHQLTVHRIIHRDLQLKGVEWCRALELSENNCVTHLTRWKQQLKRYSDPTVDFIRFKSLLSNHHSTRRTTGFMHQSEPKAKHRSQPSTTHMLLQQVGYGVRCRVKNGYDWTDICWLQGEGEWPATVMSRCLSRCFQQSNHRRHVCLQESALEYRARDTIQLLQRDTIRYDRRV